MGEPGTRAAERGLAVAALLVAVAGEATATAVGRTTVARWNEVAVAAVVLAYGAVGLLIVWHRPGHPVGRLSAAAAPVWAVGEALVALGYDGLARDPQSTGGALTSVVGGTLRGLPWLVVVMWLPLVFPDGVRLQTRLARFAARFVALTLTIFVVGSLLSPTTQDTRLSDVPNPIGAPNGLAVVFGGLAALSLVLGIVGIGLGVAVLVQRYRRTGALGRQQTAVFAAAFVPPVLALALSFFDASQPWVFGVVSIGLPVALGVAVLQRRLYDLPLVVNRSLTYGGLWLLIALLYAVTVGGVGAFVQQRDAAWLPWAAAGVVAVSFAPMRDALQRAANRVTYGQWAEPGEVLARTGRRLADASDVEGLLVSLAEDLAHGLGLDFVEIRSLDESLAAVGEPGGAVDEMTLTAYGAPVGLLRWRRRVLRESDRALLTDLATQLGAAVHAGRLVRSLRAAQERLVLAREEERRRLRRDLHDGLGPALAGLTLRVDTVRNLRGDPAHAEAELLRLREGVQSAVLDVRRIVEGLRPAALDDLGLVEAVHRLADRSTTPAVEVACEPLPRLPAAVEVAAYRIIQEALSNATRHGGARQVRVGLCLDGTALAVTVADDGSGEVVPRPGGVGLSSMRERAEEIGGRFELDARPGSGTVLSVVLPAGAS